MPSEKFRTLIADYLALFDRWANIMGKNISEDLLNNNYAENRLYKIISSSFQAHDMIDLDRLRKEPVYYEYCNVIGQWDKLYQEKLFSNGTSVQIIRSIDELGQKLFDEMMQDHEILRHHEKTLRELKELRDNYRKNAVEKKDFDLENLLVETFNLIEKSYVELAYSKLEQQIKEKQIDEEEFWEEPVTEYIMETWWPKRRVYLNKVLLIDIAQYPSKIHFVWKDFMDEKFYKSGIYGFLKTLRNQLTHVKTTDYHEQLLQILYTKDVLEYWWRINVAIVLYVICYTVTH